MAEAKPVDPNIVHSNRNLAASLGVTSVATMTFLLFFLYDRVSSGQFDNTLFQLTMLVVILAMFLFMYAATFYYRVVVPSPKRAEREKRNHFLADLFMVFGLFMLSLEPALILFTIRLNTLALVATVLWIIAVVFTLMENDVYYRPNKDEPSPRSA
jgi:uncharacterized membrane protein YidH (DUF202 family)